MLALVHTWNLPRYTHFFNLMFVPLNSGKSNLISSINFSSFPSLLPFSGQTTFRQEGNNYLASIRPPLSSNDLRDPWLEPHIWAWWKIGSLSFRFCCQAWRTMIWLSKKPRSPHQHSILFLCVWKHKLIEVRSQFYHFELSFLAPQLPQRVLQASKIRWFTSPDLGQKASFTFLFALWYISCFQFNPFFLLPF